MAQRRLYLGQGASSLFSYCVDVLRLSREALITNIERARFASVARPTAGRAE